MKRRALVLAPLGLIGATRAAPVAAIPVSTGTDPAAPAVADIRITGSSMALTVVRRIGEAFAAGPGGNDPRTGLPRVGVTVPPSLGSTGALRAVGAGLLDLAILSRAVSEAERAAGYVSAPLASTPLAFVTRVADPARTLSLEEVARVLAGDLAHWPDGGPLRFVRRQPSDGDWDLLATLSPAVARAVPVAKTRPGVLTSTNDADHAASLERLPGAFGLLALGQVTAEGRALRPASVGGVTPSVTAMRAGAWPLVKEMHVARHASARPEVLAFEAFLRGPGAARIFAATDHLPVAPVSA